MNDRPTHDEWRAANLERALTPYRRAFPVEATVVTAELDRLKRELAEARGMLDTVWPCVVRTEWAIRTAPGAIYSMRDEQDALKSARLAEVLRRPVEVVSREVREGPWTPVDVTSATETAEPPSVRVCGPDEASEAPTEAHGGRAALIAETEARVRRELVAAIERERDRKVPKPVSGEAVPVYDRTQRIGFTNAVRIVDDHPIGGAS